MNRLFKTIVLTIAAVPFLVAAPAAKRPQTAANSAATGKAKTKPTKKHVRKVKESPATAKQ